MVRVADPPDPHTELLNNADPDPDIKSMFNRNFSRVIFRLFFFLSRILFSLEDFLYRYGLIIFKG